MQAQKMYYETKKQHRKDMGMNTRENAESRAKHNLVGPALNL